MANPTLWPASLLLDLRKEVSGAELICWILARPAQSPPTAAGRLCILESNFGASVR